MSSTITISELQNVEAFAMKHIAQEIGLNVRPCEACFVEETGLWKVPLRAIVPRRVTKRDRETKVFIYYLDEVGHLMYEKTDKTFVLRSSPSSSEVERELTQRFTNLTERIEREILKEGQKNWGKLNWIKTFLDPMYSIVVNILSRKEMSINTLEQKDHWKFAELLIEEEYIKIDRERPNYLLPTDNLTGLWERLYKEAIELEQKPPALFTIAENVIGKVFANRYAEIKTDLHINPPTAYVDATKVYYIDAVRFGENIPITEDELFFEYQKIGTRPFRQEIPPPRFTRLLSELVAVELLDREEDYIIGRQRIFDNLVKYRDEVLQGATEAPDVVEIG